MTTALLVFLTLFDMAILGFLFVILHRKADGEEVLREMTEERQLAAELLATAKEEIQAARHDNRQALSQMKHLAAEIEQEIKNSKDTIGAHMSEIIKELKEQVDRPLLELTKKQNSMELLWRKLASEKQRLMQVIARGEKLSRFFNDEVPYEEVLKDIEYKKYDDARKLLAQGISREQVAAELGLSLTEIQLVQGIAHLG